jgi:hypothetical protein
MRTPVEEIQALLAASRDMADAGELDVSRLQQWRAEREKVFTRLQNHDLASVAAASPELKALIRELIALDGQIRGRVIEYQESIGAQIAASQRVRRVLLPTEKNSARLLRISA